MSQGFSNAPMNEVTKWGIWAIKLQGWLWGFAMGFLIGIGSVIAMLNW